MRACEDTVEGHASFLETAPARQTVARCYTVFLMESCIEGLKEEGPRSELVIEKAALEKVRRGEGSVRSSERSRAR